MSGDEQQEAVKASAKQLLSHLHEKLVQDWRRKVDVTNDVNSTIRRILDEGLPQAPYTPDIFTAKVQLVFDHVLTAYGDDGDDGESAYSRQSDHQSEPQGEVTYTGPLAPNTVAEDLVARIHADPNFAARVARELSSSEP